MMIAISMIANVALTFSVAYLIWRNAARIDDAFGTDTPARRILACMYATIGLISVYALVQLASNAPETAIQVALTLLPLQVIYKLMTVVTLSWRHPVVRANLGIVVLHSITLLSLIYSAFETT